MDPRDFMTHFEAEVRRLRLNMWRLTGLATGGAEAQNELLAHMRSLEPGVSWADVFPGERLREPPPEVADIVSAGDADPDHFWRWRDVRQALSKEAERVLSVEHAKARAEGNGFALDYPHGPEHALRVMRSLPDAAGWDAWSKALAASPPDPKERG